MLSILLFKTFRILYTVNFQIMYAFSSVASIALTNGTHNIIRMIPQGIDLASGLSRFVTFFNWTRVMIITQNFPAFVEVDK